MNIWEQAHTPRRIKTLISLAKRLQGNQVAFYLHLENELQIKLRQSSSNFLFQVLKERSIQKLDFPQLEDSDFANLCIANCGTNL